MPSKEKGAAKPNLHKRNKNAARYDLEAMCKASGALKPFVRPNKYGAVSIDFSDPTAIRALNTAILKFYYGIDYWSFPEENLCPPIPGRAEYIHHMADLLAESNKGEVPTGEAVSCLDVGTGASCIYPIIAVTEYEWKAIGTETNPESIKSAQKIIDHNPSLKGKVKLRLQEHPDFIYKNVLGRSERLDLSICNPPFHSSESEAKKGTARKVKNLSGQKSANPKLNFSGIHQELIYKGGEVEFIKQMIKESKSYAINCLWFSTLVSKEANLKHVYKLLKPQAPKNVETINIRTGNKASRIVAWSFFSSEQRKNWFSEKANHGA